MRLNKQDARKLSNLIMTNPRCFKWFRIKGNLLVAASYFAIATAANAQSIGDVMQLLDGAMQSQIHQPRTPSKPSQVAQPASHLGYTVAGLTLGSHVEFGGNDYDTYQCGPSSQFAGFTWCQRRRSEGSGRTQFTRSNSILHSSDGTVVYVNGYVEPWSFGVNDINTEIARLSARYGATSAVLDMPPVQEGPSNGVIASWGAVKLLPLDAASLSILASGGSLKKGLMIDFIGDFQKSALQGLPVYQLTGGAGYVWTAKPKG